MDFQNRYSAVVFNEKEHASHVAEDIQTAGASFVVNPKSGGISAMSWILWTILISCGCVFIVFLMSCLNLAKQADEKIDKPGPDLNS